MASPSHEISRIVMVQGQKAPASPVWDHDLEVYMRVYVMNNSVSICEAASLLHGQSQQTAAWRGQAVSAQMIAAFRASATLAQIGTAAYCNS